eukprot:5100347-Pleurochrysis_carterae.AAC.1
MFLETCVICRNLKQAPGSSLPGEGTVGVGAPIRPPASPNATLGPHSICRVSYSRRQQSSFLLRSRNPAALLEESAGHFGG